MLACFPRYPIHPTFYIYVYACLPTRKIKRRRKVVYGFRSRFVSFLLTLNSSSSSSSLTHSLFGSAQVPIHDGEIPTLAVLLLACSLVDVGSLITQLETRAGLIRSLDG